MCYIVITLPKEYVLLTKGYWVHRATPLCYLMKVISNFKKGYVTLCFVTGLGCGRTGMRRI